MSIFKISKNLQRRFVRTIKKLIYEMFENFRLQFMEVVFWKSYFQKNRKCTQLPQNDLERYKVKGTPYMYNYSMRVPISPRFALRFRFPDGWGFWLLHNEQLWWIWNFRIKDPLKLEIRNFSRLWRPVREKLATSLKTFGCDLQGGAVFWIFARIGTHVYLRKRKILSKFQFAEFQKSQT